MTSSPFGRDKTDAMVEFDESDWANSAINDWRNSPDISSIVSEITSRGGWAAEQAMGFLVLGVKVGDSNDYGAVMRRGGKILEGATKFMKITILDDTGKIDVRINRFNFEKLNVDNIYEAILEEDIYVLFK